MKRYFVVLGDGETYDSLDECRVVALTEREIEAAENGKKIKNMKLDGRVFLANGLWNDIGGNLYKWVKRLA